MACILPVVFCLNLSTISEFTQLKLNKFVCTHKNTHRHHGEVIAVLGPRRQAEQAVRDDRAGALQDHQGLHRAGQGGRHLGVHRVRQPRGLHHRQPEPEAAQRDARSQLWRRREDLLQDGRGGDRPPDGQPRGQRALRRPLLHA